MIGDILEATVEKEFDTRGSEAACACVLLADELLCSTSELVFYNTEIVTYPSIEIDDVRQVERVKSDGTVVTK